jgi:hypothetical protein
MAPGIAPTNTANGDTGFKGVYAQVYKNIEIAPKRALFGLIPYNMPSPTMVNIIAKIIAVVLDILPVGRGLFIVLFIKESVSFSIT